MVKFSSIPNRKDINIKNLNIKKVLRKVKSGALVPKAQVKVDNTSSKRFASLDMQMAQTMNKIAIHDDYCIRSKNFKREMMDGNDFIRLTAPSSDASYKRAFWINPKDNKGYHLLDEGRTKDGLQKLRILDEHGIYVKNAEVKPTTVLLADIQTDRELFYSLDGNDLTHTDFINIFARRYNPFAKYKNIKYDASPEGIKNFYDDIGKKCDKDTTFLSSSCGIVIDISDKWPAKEVKEMMPELMKDIEPMTTLDMMYIKSIPSQVRLLYSSGNGGARGMNGFVTLDRIEGVGGLNKSHKVHKSSSAKNSLFTKHYENMDFNITKSFGGINMTGLYGTDYPMDRVEQCGEELLTFSGTSFAAPIRAAKLALNEMMKDVL